MTETMIERVAAAICVEASWSASSDSQKDGFRRQARDAIAAMREPTEAMLKAGVIAPNYLEDQSSGRGCSNIFAAMVDAALGVAAPPFSEERKH